MNEKKDRQPPKYSIVYGVLFSVVIAIVWSMVFVNMLGTAGTGVGIALSAAFAPFGALIGSAVEKGRKKGK